ncbi:MAG: LCP family protein [Bacillota bacterium]|nr:LCP family protein [Bacillota bacterium]
MAPDLHNFRRNRRNRAQGLRIVAGLLSFFVICALAGALWGYRVLKSVYTEVEGAGPTSIKPGERINVLFLGLDGGVTASGKTASIRSDASYTRTDTMILASVDPDSGELSAVWIPRDTRVKIPGRNTYEKIAHAHAYGGPKLAMEAVSANLGVDVHYYVRTDFEGFAHLVDIIGGVEMDVPRDMRYKDPYQDLVIDIKAGHQVLNGQKALQFVRFREYPNGDIGRVEAQQMFAEALVGSLFRLGVIPRLPALAKEAMNWVDTNMEPSRIVSMANLSRQVSESDIRIDMLPGQAQDIREGGQLVSYWVLDDDAAKSTIDSLVRGIDRSQNAGIKVEVLDGSDRSQAAQAAAKMLKDAGFEVVRVAQADRSNYQSTSIIDRTGSVTAAKSVSRVILPAAPSTKITSKAEKDPKAGVTVIIGLDFTPK